MFYYLATPYSDSNPRVMEQRFLLAELATATFLLSHVPVYSPIVHNHEIAHKYDLPETFDWWKGFDLNVLAQSAALIVGTLPGWEDSKGVTSEIEFMEVRDASVYYLKMPENVTQDIAMKEYVKHAIERFELVTFS